MAEQILITGGTGFIGSHTVVELLGAGYQVSIIDSLVNSHQEVLRRIELITGKKPEFIKADVCDREVLRDLFKKNNFSAVIHFAGLKAVGESIGNPVGYLDNNICSTLALLSEMRVAGVKRLIFSSSATVYGSASALPFKEDSSLGTVNPYGKSKLLIEQICREIADFEDDWKIVLLRYFNPVGAHSSGYIGEDPQGPPNNLMPYIMQVAVGKRERLSIFGNDYNTHDGTCLRDYIHVVDLARGHLAALEGIENIESCEAVNLGTGSGISVKEVVSAVSQVLGRELPHEFVQRRPGDVAMSYADPSKAQALFGWKSSLGLEDMCRDSWNWQRNNPEGYESKEPGK